MWSVRFNGHYFGNSLGVFACDVILSDNDSVTLYLHAALVVEIHFTLNTSTLSQLPTDHSKDREMMYQETHDFQAENTRLLCCSL